MDIVSLINLLDHPHQAPHWLGRWGLKDIEAGRSRLSYLSEQGLPLDLLATICDQLSDVLPSTQSPDDVLAALADFIAASRSPLALAALFERDVQALPTLISVLGLGATWRQTLIADPEAFDLLRMTDGQPVGAQWLKAEICGELAHFSDERHILAGLRRIKHRELLRILYGDVLKRQRFELVSEQLTFLADAMLEAAVLAARRKLGEQRVDKRTVATSGRFAIIALGRLGGLEQDYSETLELLLVHEPLPDDDHARRAAREYFDRLGRLVVRYLSEAVDGRIVYRIETPIVMENQSSAATGADEVLNYLDTLGRTWHRAAITKARAVAGDLDLATGLLRQLQPWVYRRYLNEPDETGIRALKRRIERRVSAAEPEASGESGGYTAARMIEDVVRFLQLLNGGDLPSVRATNTLTAIAGLEQANVLTVDERSALEDSYLRLRSFEHAHQRSEGNARPNDDPEAIAADKRARETAKRLLASAFPDDEALPPEADLLLDPQSTPDDAAHVLGRYGFKDVSAAHLHLQSLGSEHVPFLSTRRCRHFLSAISPRLLSAVAATPDPDYTLANLSRVSDSIGGKGVLWELFSFNPPSLDLYVRLCAASPYLSGILTSYPGMVDELVDSLQLARLATLDELNAMLGELVRGAEDVLPVLHGFKNSQHLQIGVRELLGKETVDSIHDALANVAEAVIVELVANEHARLVEKFGQPTIGFAASDDKPCRYAVLATGKLGAREPNYLSDIELVIVYEADGMTQLASRGRKVQKTANGHFFSQLAQRVMKSASQLTQWGRLYPVEFPLRSASGNLAVSVAELQSHYASNGPSFFEWHSLLRSRPILADSGFHDEVVKLVGKLLENPVAVNQTAEAVRFTRYAREQSASQWNVKRAPGGWLDIELLASHLLLQSPGAGSGASLAKSTTAALKALEATGQLATDDVQALSANYRWLRQVDSALRLLAAEPRHDLPEDPVNLGKMSLLLRCQTSDELRQRTQDAMDDTRRRFERILGAPVLVAADDAAVVEPNTAS